MEYVFIHFLFGTGGNRILKSSSIKRIEVKCSSTYYRVSLQLDVLGPSTRHKLTDGTIVLVLTDVPVERVRESEVSV